MSQILLNLISNAGDATQSVGEKWIRIEVVDKSDRVDITVIDSGSGIAPEIRERSLKPFFKTKAVGHGTGLGLSISKGIAEAHGGRLWLDTKSPHTRFVLSLPKKQRLAHAA